MSGQIFGYIKMFSKYDNEFRVYMKKYIDDERHFFIDKVNGKIKYEELKILLRPGDILFINRLECFGSKAQKIRDEWEWFQKQNIKIKVLDLPILNTVGKVTDIELLISNIVLDLLTYISEKEVLARKSRQKIGINNALHNGVKFGRPPAEMPEEFPEYFKKLDNYEITGKQIMDHFKLRRNTFYKVLKLHLGEARYKTWIKNRKHYKKGKNNLAEKR